MDLSIAAGERVALVGQNGSGKTTLVRHLNGLLRPTEGRVPVDGVDASSLTVAQLASRVGLVFQDPDRQIFAGSVRAEVEFGPRNLGRSGAELRDAVSAALDATGLGGEEGTNPYDLGQLASEAARTGVGAGDAHAGARARRADHRPGRAWRRACARRGRAASPPRVAR